MNPLTDLAVTFLDYISAENRNARIGRWTFHIAAADHGGRNRANPHEKKISVQTLRLGPQYAGCSLCPFARNPVCMGAAANRMYMEV